MLSLYHSPLFALLVATSTLICSTVAFNSLGEIDYIFSFGDSYTADAYDPAASISPVLGQTLTTSSGGLTWAQYFAMAANSPNTLYDLAASGATTDNAIVDAGVIPSFVQQVSEFSEYFTQGATTVPWTGPNTLFTVWFGINDVGYSWWEGETYSALVDNLLTSYDAQMSKLYAAGARNFAILNVPPTDLTPLVQLFGADVAAVFHSNIALWNLKISDYAISFSTKYTGATALLFDTNSLFSDVLNNPASYGITNTKSACDAYALLTTTPVDLDLPVCGAPISQYFWHNLYHPTFSVQKILADSFAKALVPSSSSNKLKTAP
ncbi:hypothetical protein T439DRAFT_354325 [Meredithblackwellia eburnea MCA 4105]